MVAIGLAAVWAGYAITLYGYCLVRGYDVPFTAMFRATWPGGSAPAAGTPAAVKVPAGQKIARAQDTPA
jgi:hypothetical protein